MIIWQSKKLHVSWLIIVNAIFGIVAGAITRRDRTMNQLTNILAGLVGSALGKALLVIGAAI